MDVENGKILSLVSLPDYDLNQRFSINDNIYTNKIRGAENVVLNLSKELKILIQKEPI